MKVNILKKGLIPEIGMIGPIFNQEISDKIAYQLVAKKIPVFDVSAKKLLNNPGDNSSKKYAVAEAIAKSAEKHPNVVEKMASIVESLPTPSEKVLFYGTGNMVAQQTAIQQPEVKSEEKVEKTPVIEEKIEEKTPEIEEKPVEIEEIPVVDEVFNEEPVVSEEIESTSEEVVEATDVQAEESVETEEVSEEPAQTTTTKSRKRKKK